jgi:predicted GTPase
MRYQLLVSWFVPGLIKIAEHFNLKLLAPQKKIVVLLIGNHSAGKSSFINW